MLCLGTQLTQAQDDSPDDLNLNYQTPSTYTLGGIAVSGNGRINRNVIIAYTGLKKGQEVKVPGDDIADAIKGLWRQELFKDVAIKINKVDEDRDKIYLLIDLETRPRLRRFKINGVSESEASDLREKIELVRGDIVTEQLVSNIKGKIKSYFKGEGYMNAQVAISGQNDSLFAAQSATMILDIDKGEKVKIKDITFSGNQAFDDGKLRGVLENTNRKTILNLFKSSKFIPDKYKKDKNKLVKFYRNRGYRDAAIVKDSVYQVEDDRVKIDITVNEGEQYYFGDITWQGNTEYSTSFLNTVLSIEKGEIYSPKKLQTNLRFNQRGLDISSLYMDNGFLFFNVQPVETKLYNDTVDLEIRITEGKQATIDEITVSGNTKTSDHVILRELRTRPGDKFSRSDIIRSRRELSQLGYFDAKKINITPQPDPEEGTVDINYDVVEKPSDQLQLQGGWGAGQLVGSIGIQFNNFSLDKIDNFDAWRPLPAGDGQKLSLRAYSNGPRYSSLNFSFTEPWFGGKKPNALTVGAYYSVQARGGFGSSNRRSLQIIGANVGLGKRLQFPDNYFRLKNTLEFQQYNLNDYRALPLDFNNGTSYTISLKHKISRNSVNKRIYPTSGSEFSLSLKYTPPISAFSSVDYGEVSAQRRFKWIEFHRWKFKSSYFLNLGGDLVLNPRANFGYLGFFNDEIGVTPFERFFVGGDGLQGFRLDGRELIRLRGYKQDALSPQEGANTFTKLTMELRYPVIQKRSATIYFLGFLEGGNSWLGIDKFNPSDIHRSAGGGVRVFLPMFGLLGVDWGYGFDSENIPGNPGQIHISIGQRF
jgi:outer membrane protein insertion porin family